VTFEDVVRARRTHKAYGAEPVAPELVRELLDLARWAPNHHLTNPWRFRVLGPASLDRLKAAADALQPGSGAKLDRAPTLVAVTSIRTPDDPVADEEDLLATACAAYLVLLAAEARGLASYWRTPAVLRSDDGLRALGADPGRERGVGLLHLGPRRQEQPPPDRAPLDDVVAFLD
jgi:nitroreductase